MGKEKIDILKNDYNVTLVLCLVSVLVRTVAVVFPPLLFITLQQEDNLVFNQIIFLVMASFLVQLAADLFSQKLIRDFGLKTVLMAADIVCAVGFACTWLLDRIMPNLFVALLLSNVAFSFGAGLLRALLFPIIKECPSDHTEKLTKYYPVISNGAQVLTIAVATLMFLIFGSAHWKIFALVFAVIPLVTGVLFSQVRLPEVFEENDSDDEQEQDQGQESDYFGKGIFWQLIIIMICSTAAEFGISQWASIYFEASLGTTNIVANLLGPILFAVSMGASRLVYMKWGRGLGLKKYMLYSAIGFLAGYVILLFPEQVPLNALGILISGFSAGIFLPGTMEIAKKRYDEEETSVFRFLLLAGDVGCIAGPTLVGRVTEYFFMGGNLHMGFIAGLIFPAILLIFVAVMKEK